MSVKEHIQVVIKALRAYTRDRIDMARAKRVSLSAASAISAVTKSNSPRSLLTARRGSTAK